MKNHFLASLRKRNFTVIFLLVMSGIIGFFAFIYPTVYNDIAISNGTIDHLDWSNFSLMRMLQIGKSYYDAIAWPDMGLSIFGPIFPLFAAIFKTAVFLCLFVLTPFILIQHRVPGSKQDYHLCMYAIACIAAISLTLPYHTSIINDIFNNTNLANYLLNSGFTPLLMYLFLS